MSLRNKIERNAGRYSRNKSCELFQKRTVPWAKSGIRAVY